MHNLYVCPNCKNVVDQDDKICVHCDADFGAENGWQPILGKPREPYVPNNISLWDRSWTIIFSVIGMVYCVYSLYVGEFYIASKRSASRLTGPAATVMSLALFVGVLHMISVIVDHYDRRDNESRYKQFANLTKYVLWVLLGLVFFMPQGNGR